MARAHVVPSGAGLPARREAPARAGGPAAVPDLSPSHEQDALRPNGRSDCGPRSTSCPERLRIVVVLASIEGHGLKEVASIVEAPEGTVKSRLFEARQKLQEMLR